MTTHNVWSFFLLIPFLLNVFTDGKNCYNFLAEGFKSLGQRKWHLCEAGVAALLGIGRDVERDRSGAVRLAMEMRHMLFLCVLSICMFLTN